MPCAISCQIMLALVDTEGTRLSEKEVHLEGLQGLQKYHELWLLSPSPDIVAVVGHIDLQQIGPVSTVLSATYSVVVDTNGYVLLDRNTDPTVHNKDEDLRSNLYKSVTAMAHDGFVVLGLSR